MINNCVIISYIINFSKEINSLELKFKKKEKMIKQINSINDVKVGDILVFNATYASEVTCHCGEDDYTTFDIVAKAQVLEIKHENNFVLVKNLFDFDIDKININNELTDRRLHLMCNYQILLIDEKNQGDNYNPEPIFCVNGYNDSDINFILNWENTKYHSLTHIKKLINISQKNNKENIEKYLLVINKDINQLEKLDKKSNIYTENSKSLNKTKQILEQILDIENNIKKCIDEFQQLIYRYKNLTGIDLSDILLSETLNIINPSAYFPFKLTRIKIEDNYVSIYHN